MRHAETDLPPSPSVFAGFRTAVLSVVIFVLLRCRIRFVLALRGKRRFSRLLLRALVEAADIVLDRRCVQNRVDARAVRDGIVINKLKLRCDAQIQPLRNLSADIPGGGDQSLFQLLCVKAVALSVRTEDGLENFAVF